MKLLSQPLSLTVLRAIIISSLTLPLLMTYSDANAAKQPRRAPQHEVQAQAASWHNIRQHYLSTATATPIKSVKILNQRTAQVKRVYVDLGDKAKAGDVLIELDAQLIEAELNKSQAQLKQAQLNLKRLTNLASKQLSSEDEIAKAQTALNIAQANVDIQQYHYENSRIRAPFSGVIKQRLVNEGDVLPLHQHLLTLIDTSQLKIQASFSAIEFNNIKIGDKAKIICGTHTFKAKVSRLSPALDVSSQQGLVEISWPHSTQNITPGQLCRVIVLTDETPHLMIPNAAIQYDVQGAYVFIADKTAIKTPITTGIKYKNYTEVLSGLSEGDYVIFAGLLDLSSGDNIKINTPK